MLQQIKIVICLLCEQIDGTRLRHSRLRARAIWATHCNRTIELQRKREQVRFSLSLQSLEFQRRWAISQGRLFHCHAK